jgi:DNA-binding response OmpR family regulator
MYKRKPKLYYSKVTIPDYIVHITFSNQLVNHPSKVYSHEYIVTRLCRRSGIMFSLALTTNCRVLRKRIERAWNTHIGL